MNLLNLFDLPQKFLVKIQFLPVYFLDSHPVSFVEADGEWRQGQWGSAQGRSRPGTASSAPAQGQLEF